MKLLLGLLLTLSFNSMASKNASVASIDSKKSSFTWTGEKVTGKHYGKISTKDSQLVFDSGNIIGGKIVMDLASITVDDLDGEWKDKFLTHMKSEDFFNVEKFPEATLKVKSANAKVIKGDLTIKGKTHPVEIPYTKKGNTYTGTFKFDRTKFDMVYNSKSKFDIKKLGDKLVYDDVKVDFNITLK